ncbi:hypothetical protein H6G49_26745 [Nostoc sp. PCC 7120 = FACHB-418]|nr:hypothetical protein [Anabaena cylindrica FACHB-318]MBD2266581.1 hypothetical protein [Anabaena sp. FACHB-709]MBD2276147.1 hypothetical protein [Nostoc sp. PCC 7120 = FACHB-418]MBD2285589.1 hypothetical protein [Anabaena cylindrica FACHB-170]MBD2351295.1 hypothetical protein [Trichormus variabilis FACHB-171]HBW31487.1 hypothetical protein [Nostoc sp. UBA8866]
MFPYLTVVFSITCDEVFVTWLQCFCLVRFNSYVLQGGYINMTAYTLRQANSWFNIGAISKLGTIFAVHDGDDRPISPDPRDIADEFDEIFNPSAKPKKKVVNPDADPSTSPAIDPDSE